METGRAGATPLYPAIPGESVVRGHEPKPVQPTRPIRLGREHGRRVYVVESLDDRRNTLLGLTITQRFLILETVADCLDQILAGSEQEVERRDAFVAWALSELFLKLRTRKGVQWGYGPLGLADPTPIGQPRPSQRAASTKLLHRSRRPRLLLKNEIDTDFIDAKCLTLNLPLEIRRFHRQARQRYFGFSLNINAHQLQGLVLDSLVKRVGNNPEAGHMDHLVQRFSPTQGVEIPGWPAVFSNRTLSAVLDYYDVGKSASLRHQRIYRISYWRLGFLLESMLMHPESFLDLMPWVTQRIKSTTR